MSYPILRARGPRGAAPPRRWQPSPWPAGVVVTVAALAVAALPAATATAATAGLVPGNAVAGFGFNQRGQLGTGRTANDPALLPVLAALPAGTRVTQVAPGCEHALAVTSTGSLLAWGDNSSGQLGNGSEGGFSTTPAPVRLPAGVRIRSAAAGCDSSLALTTAGQVYSWGHNDFGQLGNGNRSPVDQLQPGLVQLPAGVRVTAVTAGFTHALALTTTGQVYAWGDNGRGELGNGAASGASGQPALVHLPAGVRVTAVTAGDSDSLAVTTRGRVLGWGDERSGALGDGHDSGTAPLPVPALLPPGIRIRSIFSGGSHTLAVTNAGAVLAFGANLHGELGTGSGAAESTVPVRTRLPAGSRVVAVGGGDLLSVAVTNQGQMLAWGDGGLLGNGSTTASNVPVPVRLDRGQFAIGTGGSAAGNFSLALVLRRASR